MQISSSFSVIKMPIGYKDNILKNIKLILDWF